MHLAICNNFSKTGQFFLNRTYTKKKIISVSGMPWCFCYKSNREARERFLESKSNIQILENRNNAKKRIVEAWQDDELTSSTICSRYAR